MSARELLHLPGLPAFQNTLFASADAARRCVRGDLRLVQDLSTGFVHNAAFDPSVMQYDADYQNEQAHSAAFRVHLDQVLALILERFGGTRVLEIGCGKGAFLELLRERGIDASGIDPAYEGDADYIVKQPFAPGIGIRAESIVLRHTLEHVRDPFAFLQNIAAANGGAGTIYIEVPCLDWILARHAWFDLFYEHVNYFRLDDVHRMFGRVLDAGHLFGGQYLYAIADLASLTDPASNAPIRDARVPDDLFAGVQRALQHPARGRAIVWGAGAKGVMFAHHVVSRGGALDFAIDINPAKHGRFLASSALEVLPPQSPRAALTADDVVYVMNSNYLAEIMATGGPHPTYVSVDHDQFR